MKAYHNYKKYYTVLDFHERKLADSEYDDVGRSEFQDII